MMDKADAETEKSLLEVEIDVIRDHINGLHLSKMMVARGFGDMPATFGDQFLVAKGQEFLTLAQLCFERAIDYEASAGEF